MTYVQRKQVMHSKQQMNMLLKFILIRLKLDLHYRYVHCALHASVLKSLLCMHLFKVFLV